MKKFIQAVFLLSCCFGIMLLSIQGITFMKKPVEECSRRMETDLNSSPDIILTIKERKMNVI